MRENIDVEIADRVDPGDGVTVTGKTATVLDRKAGRAWTGEGNDANAASTEAVRKFLGDRRTREYVG